MTQEETYNTLRTKMNDLIPSRVELKFGCEFKNIDNGEVFVQLEGLRCTEKSFPMGLYLKDIFEADGIPLEILGTPVTLQEILRVFANEPNMWSIWSDAVTFDTPHLLIMKRKDHENDPDYDKPQCAIDLTLPVSEQSQETLEWILLTISGKN